MAEMPTGKNKADFLDRRVTLINFRDNRIPLQMKLDEFSKGLSLAMDAGQSELLAAKECSRTARWRGHEQLQTLKRPWGY